MPPEPAIGSIPSMTNSLLAALLDYSSRLVSLCAFSARHICSVALSTYRGASTVFRRPRPPGGAPPRLRFFYAIRHGPRMPLQTQLERLNLPLTYLGGGATPGFGVGTENGARWHFDGYATSYDTPAENTHCLVGLLTSLRPDLFPDNLFHQVQRDSPISFSVLRQNVSRSYPSTPVADEPQRADLAIPSQENHTEHFEPRGGGPRSPHP